MTDEAHLHCPHCGSHDIDPGATGLDECRACGGLSRDGMTLVDHEARKLYEHVIVLSGGSPPNPEAVQQIVDGIAQVFDNPMVLYLADMNLDTLDDEWMARRGWVRAEALRDAYRAGQHNAAWALGGPTEGGRPVESADEVVARLTMRGTDAVLEETRSEDGAAADQPR